MRIPAWAGVVSIVMLQFVVCGNTSAKDIGASLNAAVPWEAKFTLPRQDENGWSILTPSADSRLIYVSVSGNDNTARLYRPSDPEIGSDPYNPRRAVMAYATIAAALEQMRKGYPDYVLFKRGETWAAGKTLYPKPGRSAKERSVLGYYGSDSVRPVVKFNGVDLSRSSYSAVIGIHFVASQRDPASPDFAGFNSSVNGIHALGGYNNSIVGGLLIEDCRFEWFSGNVLQSPEHGGGPVMADVILRRNIFSNHYSSTGHSQGLYTDRVSMLLEENVFDHNGWYRQGLDNVKTEGRATYYNHNTYFAESRDTILRRNLFLRSSSIGSKFASNTPSGINRINAWNVQVDNNLYVEGEVGISMGGNDDQNNGPRWDNIRVTNNVMMHIGRTRPTGRTLGWGLEITDWKSGLVRGNIFANWGGRIVSNTYALYSAGHTTEVEFSDNIIYNVAGENPLVIFGDGAIQNRIGFFNNEVQGAILMHNDLAEKGGFHHNHYSSTLNQSKWFTSTVTTNLSLADYRKRSGDTTSVAGTRNYVAPDRTVETYLTSQGLATDMDSFAAELVQQSKFNWRPALGAEAINAYIRAGFCLSGNAGCR